MTTHEIVLRTGKTKQVMTLGKQPTSLVVLHLGKRMVYDLASIDEQLRFVYVLREEPKEK